MKNGDKVTHKLTEEAMTIKKAYDTVALCFIDSAKPKLNLLGTERQADAICQLINLSLLPTQSLKESNQA